MAISPRHSVNEYYPLLIRTVIHAGDLILDVRNSGVLDVHSKPDESPVTLADKKASEYIIRRLARTGLPVLSEEGRQVKWRERKEWSTFWLVDPLDGTRDFINQSGDFTVNIALVENRKAILGFIFAPISRYIYFSLGRHRAFRAMVPHRPTKKFFDQILAHADRLPLPLQKHRFRVVASKSHFTEETQRYIEKLRNKFPSLELVHRGSSLKFCIMAEGEADLYPRIGKTMEWDTAAGQAIAEAAGCVVVRFGDRKTMIYNKKSLENPCFVVGKSRQRLSEILV